jgi:hypothetical protein
MYGQKRIKVIIYLVSHENHVVGQLSDAAEIDASYGSGLEGFVLKRVPICMNNPSVLVTEQGKALDRFVMHFYQPWKLPATTNQ